MIGLQVLASDITGLRPSLGAVLLGSIIGAFLSGIVAMQVILYYRIYPKDRFRFKVAVAVIWLLDLIHTSMASAANWSYLIDNFGNEAISDRITWMIAATIALTAIITFAVHIFFAHRILTLSRNNYYITVPIALIASARLALALVSTSKMIELKSYNEFVKLWGFIFTSGLSLAVVTDVLIAVGLIWFLNRNRTGFSSMDTIIDSITLYTLENGLLTCVTTVVSLICWVSMPHNLIFLGLHFAISKLYANAFLATLNARKVLRGKSQGSSDRSDHPMPVLFPESFNRFSRGGRYNSRHDAEPITTKVQISVEKTTEHDGEEIDIEPSSEISYPPSSPSRDRGDTGMKGIAV